jgi:hypothetical protein
MGFMGITLERYAKADQTRSAFFFLLNTLTPAEGGGVKEMTDMISCKCDQEAPLGHPPPLSCLSSGRRGRGERDDRYDIM